MKKLLFTLLSAVALTANAQTVTDQYGILYSINQTAGTAKMTYVNYLNLSSVVDLVIDSVAYNGKNYPVTEMQNSFLTGTSLIYLPSLKSISFPELLTMGEYCFNNGGGDSDFLTSLETINLPKLQTMGNECFVNGGGGSHFFTAVTNVSMPNLQTMGNRCFVNAGACHMFTAATNVSMPSLQTMGVHCFRNGRHGSHMFTAATNVSMPSLQTMGEYCFYNDNGGSNAFTAATNVSMPNLQTMGNECFHTDSPYFMTVLEVLDFPSLQEMGIRCVYGGFDNLSVVRQPSSVEMGGTCISEIQGRPHVYPYETGSVGQATGTDENFQNTYARIHAPEGMAALMMDHWRVAETTEIYSPVKVSKTNSNYNSYSIRTTDAHASYTQDGTTYVNNYNFNFALDKAACEAPLPAGYTTFTQTADYHYNWYVATGYSDVSKYEGKLTIETPEMSRFTRPVTDSIGVRYYPQGVAPGEGFLLKGPANTDTLYVPIHYNNQAYADGNYFRAGTGAAVAKESGGYRNFYYTDPTGFWECDNTVIPTNRAYLALPAGMTANGKQISFVIDDGETTGIVNITETTANGENDTWHTIDGTRLNGKPTTKGIYIHNGRKEVIQ